MVTNLRERCTFYNFSGVHKVPYFSDDFHRRWQMSNSSLFGTVCKDRVKLFNKPENPRERERKSERENSSLQINCLYSWWVHPIWKKISNNIKPSKCQIYLPVRNMNNDSLAILTSLTSLASLAILISRTSKSIFQ